MHNEKVAVVRNSLLSSCSRLFQEVGPWSFPVAQVARSRRQDSFSSGGSSEHYIQELEQIIPESDAEVFISIVAGLTRVIRDLEESEQRGAPTTVDPSRQSMSSTVWLAYYGAMESRVAELARKWDAIVPAATRNSARLTRVHQEEAINKVLHVVRSNNLRQFNETHFNWENHRHPVLASARASLESAYLPLDVPRSSLQLEDPRGVSGVIQQSRIPRLCAYEEMELTYYRNDDALEAKRRQLARNSAHAQILPLGYMKHILEQRLAKGLTEPAEPLLLELISAQTPKPAEESSVMQRLNGVPGCETPLRTKPDHQMLRPPNEVGNSLRWSLPNLDKPLPPIPTTSSRSPKEENAESAQPKKGDSTSTLNWLDGRSNPADRSLSAVTGLGRSKSTHARSYQHSSTPLSYDKEMAGFDHGRRHESNDETTFASTVAQRSLQLVPVIASRPSSAVTHARCKDSASAGSQTSHNIRGPEIQGTDRAGGGLGVAKARRASRSERGGCAATKPPDNALWLEGARATNSSNLWQEDLGRQGSRRSRPQKPRQPYEPPGTIRTQFSIRLNPSSPMSEYQYRGLEEDTETRKARLRAKAERLGARTTSKQAKAVGSSKRPTIDCHCCCCCPCCPQTVSTPCI